MPDVALVRAERLPPPHERIGAMPVIPDLAVEIVSPSDRITKVRDKIRRYLEAGVPLIWLIEPRRRQVTVYRPGQPEHVLGMADELDGGEVLPGFRLAVAELFRD
jgi:Uma2 family endonuclease